MACAKPSWSWGEHINPASPITSGKDAAFEATTGVHIIEVRATDANGKVQSGTHQDVVPNGAEGWHAITVDAS